MKAQDVISILELLERQHIDAWVDGGWGVDALLGKQTREHADLDLAVPLDRMPEIINLVEAAGYRKYEDEMPTRLDVRDQSGRRIDFHPLIFDQEGKWYLYRRGAFRNRHNQWSSRQMPEPCYSSQISSRLRTRCR